MGSVIDISRNPAGLLGAVSAAEAGEEGTVVRDGKPIAKLVPITTDIAGRVTHFKDDAYIHALEELSARMKAQPAIDLAATDHDLYDEDGLP